MTIPPDAASRSRAGSGRTISPNLSHYDKHGHLKNSTGQVLARPSYLLVA